MKPKYWYKYLYNQCPHCGDIEYYGKKRIYNHPKPVDKKDRKLIYADVCGPCEDNDWVAGTVT